jgi:septum formation protein
MSEDEIWAYIKTGEPMDKAGAYGVQGMGSFFIERIEGDFYSVMGLPLHLLYQLLKQINLHGSILGSHS